MQFKSGVCILRKYHLNGAQTPQKEFSNSSKTFQKTYCADYRLGETNL